MMTFLCPANDTEAAFVTQIGTRAPFLWFCLCSYRMEIIDEGLSVHLVQIFHVADCGVDCLSEKNNRLSYFFPPFVFLNIFSLVTGIVAEQFLNSTATQLTYHGLCELTSTVQEGELCVFFRNNHFSTMIKFKVRASKWCSILVSLTNTHTHTSLIQINTHTHTLTQVSIKRCHGATTHLK